MAKIIIVNGFPQSGKDLFCQYCKEAMDAGYCKTLSSVDFVKYIARRCGWNGEKTPKNRKFLSDLKDLLTEWNDIPFKEIKKEIIWFLDTFRIYDVDAEPIIFIHTREPKELQRYKDELGARTLLIRRPAVENIEQSNHADNEVLNFQYDYMICNTGTEKDLKNKANKFIINLLKEDWKSKIPKKEGLNNGTETYY